MKELIKKLTANLSEQDLEEVIMSSDMAAAFTVAKANLNMDQKEFTAYIESALAKATPKKVKLWEQPRYHARNYPCPTCGEMFGIKVNKRTTRFCSCCGQALDWGE